MLGFRSVRRAPRARLLAAAAALAIVLAEGALAAPQNVILMIGDGMGFGHVEAARLYAGSPFAFEGAPHQAQMTTDSYTSQQIGGPTDSAAAATAMSTGRKVHNTVVSVAVPGDVSELETLGETMKARGKSVGLVTTSYLTDATPAAMAAHALIRIQTEAIADDYLNDTRVDVLLGGGANGLMAGAGLAAGYTVVSDRAGLEALGTSAPGPVLGLFGDSSEGMPFEWDHARGTDPGYDTLPFLHEMTSSALSFLDDDPDGFFLMIEQEGTDRAGHQSGSGIDRIGRDVFAVLEFDRAVEAVLAWMAGRDDTLLLVTADHETGGLEVLGDNGVGFLPTVSWSTSDHTRTNVPVYAFGPSAELVSGVIDNTDIRSIAIVPEPGTILLVAVGLAGLAARGRGRPRISGGTEPSRPRAP
ncbi:alkaline phosphatase [Myxococcaceae bacterium]|nr:alkaline phosphatase [Myxococcaceae bacterium]